LELLSRPIPHQNFVLLEGFWPFYNWKVNYEHVFILTIINVDLENPMILPYYGPKSMHPFLNINTYTFICDFFVGNFVFVQSTDPIVYPMWMGKAESDVVKDQDNANYRKVYVQWWVPMKKGAKNDEELYHNYWLNKWKCNNPKQWVEFSCVAFSFLARSNVIVNSMISIKATHASKAKANFDAAN
jgi:hypothetical protein